MKANSRRYFLALLLVMAGCSIQAQIIRPVTPGQNTGGGIWISGPGITGDGTGIHNGETLILAVEDSIVNTYSVAAAGGAGAGKITVGDLRFRKPVNANSLPFVSAAGKGSFLSSIKINYYQKDVVILSITLSDVIITKYSLYSSDCSGNSCTGLYEEIAVSFKHMQYADNAGHSMAVY
jgi:type VI protein secretion system component Hcp